MAEQQENLKKLIVDTVDDRIGKAVAPTTAAVRGAPPDTVDAGREVDKMARALAAHRGVALKRLTRR